MMTSKMHGAIRSQSGRVLRSPGQFSLPAHSCSGNLCHHAVLPKLIQDLSQRSSIAIALRSLLGHAHSKWLSLAPFSIHVMGIEIARLARVNNDVGLSDGAAAALASSTNFVVFEILSHYHFSY